MKAEQEGQDNVPNLGRLTIEQLEHAAKQVLLSYGEANLQSKKTAAEKKQQREKAIPVLRLLRARHGHRGDGQWQAWFDDNKKDFGGITIRTVNRWLQPKQDKPKTVNLDTAGVVIHNGVKFPVESVVPGRGDGRIIITIEPKAFRAWQKEYAAKIAAEKAAESAPEATAGLAAVLKEGTDKGWITPETPTPNNLAPEIKDEIEREKRGVSEPTGDELRHHNAIRELEELGEFGITSWTEFEITHALEVRNIDYTAQDVAAIRRHPRMLEMEDRMRAGGWDLIWTIIDELGLMPPQATEVQKG